MITKEERYKAEIAVYAGRVSAAGIAMRDWLYIRQAEINAQWPNATGDELLQLQGEAKLVARQIALIEHGPKIKPTEGIKS